MAELMLTDEPTVRLSAFLGVLTLMVLWESLAPRRPRKLPRWYRWSGNFGILAIDTLLIRLLLPLSAVGVAAHAEAQGWGLFRAIDASYWFAIIASVMILDLAIYTQHALFHFVPPLWRLHRVHHADLELDATTGVRFHPIEILLSMGIKLGVVVAIGAPALAVLIFEVLLNATSMFNHANVRLPERLDRLLRLIVVTPDMHRVHHSILRTETNSNFGFNLPWWDRLFGTYRAQPQAGHDEMILGIEQFRDPRELRLNRMLWQPFRSDSRHA